MQIRVCTKVFAEANASGHLTNAANYLAIVGPANDEEAKERAGFYVPHPGYGNVSLYTRQVLHFPPPIVLLLLHLLRGISESERLCGPYFPSFSDDFRHFYKCPFAQR